MSLCASNTSSAGIASDRCRARKDAPTTMPANLAADGAITTWSISGPGAGLPVGRRRLPDFFPVAGPRGTDGDDVYQLDRSERPFLVNPVGTRDISPEELITFRGFLAAPRGSRGHRLRRGTIIIDLFGLNLRDDLTLQRCYRCARNATRRPGTDRSTCSDDALLPRDPMRTPLTAAPAQSAPRRRRHGRPRPRCTAAPRADRSSDCRPASPAAAPIRGARRSPCHRR